MTRGGTNVSKDVLKQKTILIVEDEPDLREPIAMELESWGAHVLQAENGNSRIRTYRELRGRRDHLGHPHARGRRHNFIKILKAAPL